MGLEAGTFIDDLVATNPVSGDLRAQGDDHIRLLKSTLKATFPRAGKAFPFFAHATKTGNYSILATDEHMFFQGDATSAVVGFTLPNLAAADAGWFCYIRAKNITNGVTITPASGTIDNAASFTFEFAAATALVWWSGTEWLTVVNKVVDVVDLPALSAPAVDDSVLVYDLSATANRKMALSDLFKTINVLATKAAPALADVLSIYDTAGTAAKGLLLSNLLNILNLLTEDTTPDLSADFVLTYDTSASAVKKVKPFNLAGFSSQLMHIREEQASGTDSGNSPAAGAWRTVGVNTTKTSEITGASLVGNVLSLPAGTYWLDAYMSSPNLSGGKMQLRMQNTTDGVTLVTGMTFQNSPDGGGGTQGKPVPIRGRFTLAGTKNTELQVQLSLFSNVARAAGFGTEVYVDWMIWRIK